MVGGDFVFSYCPLLGCCLLLVEVSFFLLKGNSIREGEGNRDKEAPKIGSYLDITYDSYIAKVRINTAQYSNT